MIDKGKLVEDAESEGIDVSKLIEEEKKRIEEVKNKAIADESNKKSSSDNVQRKKVTSEKISKPVISTPPPTYDNDYFQKSIVDYGKELEKIKKKSTDAEEKITQLEDLQQKILSTEKYSFGWLKTLLELEILSSNENKNTNKTISISFGRVEFDEGTQRTLILKYPSRYIPQFMEDLENIPLDLRTLKTDKIKRVEIEVAGIRHNTLSVKLKDSSKLDGINLAEVVEARIEVTEPFFLLEELQKQINELGFDDNYNLRENLCENIEFVFGPPGTGKTTHLAKKVIDFMREPEDKKILVMTPTNKAADVLVNKIIEFDADKSYLDWLLRFGTTADAKVEKSGVFQDKTFDIKSKRKNVTVTTIARFPYDFFMLNGRTYLYDIDWDYIIIDEASMIMLAQIILPLYKKFPKKFIIAGDPFQIEPITTIDLWKGENIYSLVELYSFKVPKTVPHDYKVERLTKQYRSVPAIGEIFSNFAYDGILEHNREDFEQRKLNIDDWLGVKTLNIIKFPVSKYESIYRSRKLNGRSSYHVYSALFTFEFVNNLSERLTENNPDKKFSSGIVAPYRAQADMIEKLFATIKPSDKISIQIGTVHTFQGDECDILFAVFNAPPNISSSPEMFLNRENIINVAISRARDYLFVVMPDDNTDKVENLLLVKKVEGLFADAGDLSGQFSANVLEKLMFGKENYIEENSFVTGHQDVNVYALPERQYEIRSEDNAVDVQLH